MKNHKIHISIIHNNDKQRLQSIRSLTGDFLKSIQNRLILITSEYCWQPDIIPISKLQGLFRELMYSVLAWQWCKYIGNRRLPIIFLGASLLKQTLSYKPNKNNLLRGAIELALTSKHLRAWENFLESGEDFLWVLEDDAFLKPDSIERFLHEVIPLLEKDVMKSLFIDIAGGINIQPKQMNIPYAIKNNQLIFDRPITNTACSYIINRALCEKLIQTTILRPHLRFIGADWLLNKLFIDLIESGCQIKCIHFESTILEHGSVTGRFALLK